MRAPVVVVVGLLACSQPAKRAAPPTPPADAAIAVDAEAAEVAQVDAAVAPREQDFDWETIRKGIETARAERKGKPRTPPCGADDPNTKCTVWSRPLAARGRLLSAWPATQKLSTLALDVGSDDGVTEYHWAAVVDADDKPITKYRHVENIRRGECVVRLELSSFIGGTFANGARVALISAPPPEARAPEQ